MTDLEYQRRKAIENFPAIWERIISEWKSGPEDRFWLTYSANYLLNTAGVKWAIDPYSLFTRIGGGEQPSFSDDLDLLLLACCRSHSRPVSYRKLANQSKILKSV